MKKVYIPKEISWLSFNERVLQEAGKDDVPLLERLRFLGIYSNNLDEYFRVRVATLKRLSLYGARSKSILGYSPKSALKKIHEIVLEQNDRFEKIYTRLLTELEKENINIINEKQLDQAQADYVARYFQTEVRHRLMPLIITKESRMPDLKDDAIYFAVLLTDNIKAKKRYALLEIPTALLPRFIRLPERNGVRYIIYLDDIIRFGLRELFFIFEFDEISAYSIKLTKDAELEIGDDLSESYTEKVTKSLQQRKKGTPVRFVFDRNMPQEMLRMLAKKLKLGSDDVRIPGERYQNLKDFMQFTFSGSNELRYNPLEAVPHRDIKPGSSILSVIKEKDLMLYFPYHSFDHFIDILREASIDPAVKSISVTLYRLAKNSSVINALLNASANGKTVTTVVELQARFDEEANIIWGSKLIEGGVKVIYGVPGLKVHAKLCLITRLKGETVQRFAAVGTGNFNEETARIYTDHLLLTTNKKITNDVQKTFDFFTANYRKDKFYHILLSPFYLRSKLMTLIDNEIRNARRGQNAYICIKINNLTDSEIISKLYRAAAAGVKIRLIVRGMLSMVPCENIEAISIVDRFLEHSRFLIFCNNGKELIFLSSADLMPRNLDRRIEVTCPVFDRDLKREIRDIFDIQWNDNVKARIFDELQSNVPVTSGDKPHRSQIEVLSYLKER